MPATREAMAALDTDALVDAELAKLERHFKDYPEALRPKGNLRTFVKMCFTRHKPMIAQWGGWSKTIQITEGVRTKKDILQEVEPVLKRWRKGAKLKNRSFEPVALMGDEPAPAYDDGYYEDDWHDGEDDENPQFSEAHRLFCTTNGCHLPRPNLLSPLFVSRTFAGPTAELEYATGCKVEIRKGQAVTRAVLADVRKRFKDNPTYVAFWEALFEAIGITWAGAKPASFQLTCAPSDFVMMGNVGEKNSCYATGGSNEQAKLYLAQIPNSMALFVWRGDDCICRAWGLFAPKAGALEISNFYITPQKQILPGLRTALARALELTAPPELYTNDQGGDQDIGASGEYSSPIDDLQDTHGYPNGDAVLLAPADKRDAAVNELNDALAKFRKNHREVPVDEGDDPWGW